MMLVAVLCLAPQVAQASMSSATELSDSDKKKKQRVVNAINVCNQRSTQLEEWWNRVNEAQAMTGDQVRAGVNVLLGGWVDGLNELKSAVQDLNGRWDEFGGGGLVLEVRAMKSTIDGLPKGKLGKAKVVAIKRRTRKARNRQAEVSGNMEMLATR
jgi:hypothetical protein